MPSRGFGLVEVGRSHRWRLLSAARFALVHGSQVRRTLHYGRVRHVHCSELFSHSGSVTRKVCHVGSSDRRYTPQTGATGGCRMFETVADLLAQQRDSSTVLVAPVRQKTVGRKAQGPKMRRRGQNVRLA